MQRRFRGLPLAVATRARSGAALRALAAAAAIAALAPLACADPPAQKAELKSRPVRILTARAEERPERLHYIGTTSANTIKRYSFKVGGKLQRVHVERGQKIAKGDPLARLDKRDIEFAREASRYTLAKAEEARRDAERMFSKIELLHRQGTATSIDYDRAKLNLDVSQATLEQARIDFNHKTSMLADTWLDSEVDGFVVEVLGRAGEVVGPGHPVVVVRSEQQVVQVGVSQRDVKRLREGTPAVVDVDGATGTGQVITIAQIPDPRSRTYTVEVDLSGTLAEQDFYIGSIAKVGFEIGAHRGIWVPIQAVLTDGADYVYLAEGDRAVRRDLTLGDTLGTEVEVRGLRPGEAVIVEGMKNLKEGYAVQVLGERQAPDAVAKRPPAAEAH